MKKLKAIYTPKGPAREYAELALNPYKGCTHGCIYCYNNGRHSKPGEFFRAADPRKDIINLVAHDCEILDKHYGPYCPEIHLSFLGDVYQPAELDYELTRQIIEIFIDYNLSFTILTKSPYILRDVDILGPYKKFRAGFSFTSVDQAEVCQWEPGTGDITSRISALRQFHEFDKSVWVSLEPVMRVESTINVIRKLGSLVDFFWIGALNHISPPQPIDKSDARARIGAALKEFGCQYYFKNSFNIPLDLTKCPTVTSTPKTVDGPDS